MKVLVAGGAGFIGSHLVDALLNRGDSVVCVDNFFIGTKDNISHLKNNKNFTFYESDICDIDKMNEIFEKENLEYVFHLAANSDIQASANSPEIECHNTYMTTFTLLECMRNYGVKKFFFASTSAVYGDKQGMYVSEDTPNLQPISYYGGAKLGSEAMISSYTYMNDMHSLVFRFPNVIGPRLTHGVIYDFIKKLRRNPQSLEILGDGKQCKPYIYVSDLIDAILYLQNVGQGVSCYNLGVETATTVNEIADIVCAKLKLENVNYLYTGGKGGWKGDVPVFQYNLEKVHSTGWRAKYTSNEAVALAVESVIQ